MPTGAGQRNFGGDAAQECFVDLLHSRVRVRSLPGWLHTAATRRALDRMKADRRRSDRESRYGAEHSASEEVVAVDEAVPIQPNTDVLVSGVVVDIRGRTVAEALVEAIWTTGSDVAVADEDGHFRFAFHADFRTDGPIAFVRRVGTQAATFRGDISGDTRRNRSS